MVFCKQQIGNYLMFLIHQIYLFSRTDIIEDTGSSLSPEIDIGQIEGSFVFGLGLWTSEEIKFHPKTGKSLTFDTWVEYNKPIIM